MVSTEHADVDITPHRTDFEALANASGWRMYAPLTDCAAVMRRDVSPDEAQFSLWTRRSSRHPSQPVYFASSFEAILQEAVRRGLIPDESPQRDPLVRIAALEEEVAFLRQTVERLTGTDLHRPRKCL